MNSILRLSAFDEIGLAEGKEYVKNNVKVESGKIASVHNEVVPSFDESLFSYTTTSTAFSSNKSSITNGKYLTLSSSIDFKGVYKPGVSNVRPSGCLRLCREVGYTGSKAHTLHPQRQALDHTAWRQLSGTDTFLRYTYSQRFV